MSEAADQLLFSYGTLREAAIQQQVFGRLIDSASDALGGYQVETIILADERFKTLVPDAAASPIKGNVLQLTKAELAAADDYETQAYKRIVAPLQSGLRAWVYVKA